MNTLSPGNATLGKRMETHMSLPHVSVAMTTYNHADYILTSVESILNQETRFPFEIVIGEDCSTDGTHSIVESLQASFPDKIRVVTSDSNVGANKNNARTLSACRGEYIAWCEGDDYWHDPGKLEKQVDYMERHPECALVYSDFDKFDTRTGVRERNVLRNTLPDVTSSPGIVDIVGGKAGIMTCTVVTRRLLTEDVLRDDPYLHGGTFLMGDTQLWAEMSLLGHTRLLPESLATRNVLRESATQSTDVARRLRFWASSSEMFLYLCEKHGLPAELRAIHRRNWRRYMLKLAYVSGERDLALKVQQRSEDFSIKDWAWYLGATNPLARPALSAVLRAMNKSIL